MACRKYLQCVKCFFLTASTLDSHWHRQCLFSLFALSTKVNIRFVWIIGIGEFGFWEKTINDQLTVVNDLINPGAGMLGMSVSGPRVPRKNYMITSLACSQAFDGVLRWFVTVKSRICLTLHQKNMISVLEIEMLEPVLMESNHNIDFSSKSSISGNRRFRQ
jgi:hypothetical protein